MNLTRRTGWLAALLLATMALPAWAQPSAGLDGDWDGTLAAGGARLRLSLHIESRNGVPVAVLTNLDRKSAKIPVAAITRQGSSVTLRVPAVGGSFKGTLNGGTMTGIWNQGANIPITFFRRGSAPPLRQ